MKSFLTLMVKSDEKLTLEDPLSSSKRKAKSVQHSAFPSGPPRQYYLSSQKLSFRGVNGTGALFWI